MALCMLWLAMPAVAAMEPGARFKDCAVCPEMVVIPRGDFTMGSAPDEVGRAETEGPAHRASIRRFLAIGMYEVSFAEWDACVADGGCDARRPDDQGWGRGRRPAIDVSWNDAKVYLAWLSARAGTLYRLLSETEWEYAARAGGTGARAWDEATDRACTHANVADRHGCDDGHATTAPVGSYTANRFGLHDMIGNVSEWVEDCWYLGYAGVPADGAARTPSRGGHPMEPTAHLSPGSCNERGHRGGAWDSGPHDTRSASRAGAHKTTRAPTIGLRVVRQAP